MLLSRASADEDAPNFSDTRRELPFSLVMRESAKAV
jgi:LacI family transcriptional regulator